MEKKNGKILAIIAHVEKHLKENNLPFQKKEEQKQTTFCFELLDTTVIVRFFSDSITVISPLVADYFVREMSPETFLAFFEHLK